MDPIEDQLLILRLPLDKPDEFEQIWRVQHKKLEALIYDEKSLKPDQEINRLLAEAASDPELCSDLVAGLLYGILSHSDLVLNEKFFRYLSWVVKDRFAWTGTQLKKLILEKYRKLSLVCRTQLLWVVGVLAREDIRLAGDLAHSLLRHVTTGDLSDKGLWLVDQLLQLLCTHLDAFFASPRSGEILPFVIYTFLGLIPDHSGEQHTSLRNREIHLCVKIFREKFSDIKQIGRDLVRLLQNCLRIPEIHALWKDLFTQPTLFAPDFTGVWQLIHMRTNPKYFACRINPDLEQWILFVLKKVRTGGEKRYLEWIRQRYFAADDPSCLNLAADIVRYVVGAYHPGNQALKSDVLPRYAFIGWLLNMCKMHPAFGAAKAALLYDFLFYDPESPNIMNIEPATLLIVRCPHIDLSITLLEYLITEMDKYDPIDPDKKVWKGIHNSIDACLKMKVVRDLSSLKRCMQVSEFLKARFLDEKSPFKPFQNSIEAQPEAAVLEELGLSGSTQQTPGQPNPKSVLPTGGRPPPAMPKPGTQQPVPPPNSRPVSAPPSPQQNTKPGAVPPRNPTQKPNAPGITPTQPTKQAPPRSQPTPGPLSTSGPQIPSQGPPAPKPGPKPAPGPPSSDLKTSKEEQKKPQQAPQPQGQLKRSHNGEDPLATPPAKKRRIDSSVEEDILNSWTTPNTTMIQQPKAKEDVKILKEPPKNFQAKIKEFSISLSTNQPGMRNLFDELLLSLRESEEPLNATEIATILVQTFNDEFKESSHKKLLEDQAYHEKTYSSILFEHATNEDSKQKRRPIFSLLTEMQKLEACIGYRFLCFLIGKHSLFAAVNSMEIDDDELWKVRMGHESSTEKKNIFKPYTKFLSSYTTDDKLSFVVDCQTCLEHDISLFFSIFPILAKHLPDLVVGNHQLIALICSAVYPAQLQALCSCLILDQFELIGADNVPILLTTSLTWDSFAQFSFWTIVDAEFSQNEVEIIKIFPNFIKNQLKPQVHSEALQGVLSLLGSIFPTKELLEFVFQLPVDLVDFSSMVLARWSNLPRIDSALTKAVVAYLKTLLKANKTRIRSVLRHLTIFYSYHQKMRFPPTGEDSLFSTSIVKAIQTLIEKFGFEKDFPLLTTWSEESESKSEEEIMDED